MPTTETHPRCGGTILTGASGADQHIYCDRCGAFIYLSAGSSLPAGTDQAANRAARDAGDDRSPDDESATIKIIYGGETVRLTCRLHEAGAPLILDGNVTQYQTANARHRTDLAVALACRVAWPEADWPVVPAAGSIGDDWNTNSDAWDEMSYETI